MHDNIERLNQELDAALYARGHAIYLWLMEQGRVTATDVMEARVDYRVQMAERRYWEAVTAAQNCR